MAQVGEQITTQMKKVVIDVSDIANYLIPEAEEEEV